MGFGWDSLDLSGDIFVSWMLCVIWLLRAGVRIEGRKETDQKSKSYSRSGCDYSWTNSHRFDWFIFLFYFLIILRIVIYFYLVELSNIWRLLNILDKDIRRKIKHSSFLGSFFFIPRVSFISVAFSVQRARDVYEIGRGPSFFWTVQVWISYFNKSTLVFFVSRTSSSR